MDPFHSPKAALDTHSRSSGQGKMYAVPWVRAVLLPLALTLPASPAVRANPPAGAARSPACRRPAALPRASLGGSGARNGAGHGSPAPSSAGAPGPAAERERRAPFPGSILSRHLLSQPLLRLDPCPGRGTGGDVPLPSFIKGPRGGGRAPGGFIFGSSSWDPMALLGQR